MQHLEYNAQLESKKKETEQVLRRISGLPFEVSDIMGMYDPYHYRNKAILPIGRDESGNIVIGFYASRSHRIIDMDSCAIQSMDIKPFVQAVKRLAESTGTTVYDEVKHCGSLRQLMLRRSIIKGDIMAVLVVNEELKQPEMWAKGLLEAGACSVWKDINTEKGNIVLSPRCEFMAGRKDFEDDIAGVHFNLSPLSFLQVNHLQAAVLYGITTLYGGRRDDSVLVDAYCGTGILTQIMARFCGRAVGVEIVPDAVEDALPGRPQLHLADQGEKKLIFAVGALLWSRARSRRFTHGDLAFECGRKGRCGEGNGEIGEGRKGLSGESPLFPSPNPSLSPRKL